MLIFSAFVFIFGLSVVIFHITVLFKFADGLKALIQKTAAGSRAKKRTISPEPQVTSKKVRLSPEPCCSPEADPVVTTRKRKAPNSDGPPKKERKAGTCNNKSSAGTSRCWLIRVREDLMYYSFT